MAYNVGIVAVKLEGSTNANEEPFSWDSKDGQTTAINTVCAAYARALAADNDGKQAMVICTTCTHRYTHTCTV